jgi:preprotein translocase subunit YajC
MNQIILGFSFVLASSSTLFAQDAAPAATAQGSGMMNLIGIFLMLGVFFFLIILPQSRKAKKHAKFLSELQKGDAVVTQGGVMGKIHGLAEKVVTLEVSPKVYIRVDRQSITGRDPWSGQNTEGTAA